MSMSAFLRASGLSLIVVLGGCNVRPPFDAFFGADNSNTPGGAHKSLCRGGLEAKLSVEGLVVEIPPVAFGQSRVVNFLMPEKAPVGTVMTTEAWCYAANNTEVAYARVSRPYTSTRMPVITVRPAFSPSADRSRCATSTEVRGPEICIQTTMYN